MHFIKPDSSNTMKYSEQFFLKVHVDRIVKMYVDEERKLVYSIGEDRKFKVVNIDKKSIHTEFEVSGKRPNCMFVDDEIRVAYVGDSEGNVKIIDLARNPPTCVNNIKVNSKDSVSSIDVCNNLIFSGLHDTGKITVHHLADPKSSACQAALKYTFNGYKGISVVRYMKDRSELYVGHSSGVVSVFNKYATIDHPFCRLA